ncbi:erythromycin esterase-like protein [Actinoplanes octamycinicus]|uniref:Erythromycin esterase-like protein n=1 Tax=Actinoplanes octamycinicus TaxID=135948 RepID=A0A7W7M8G8_9ACTN|nr:erythromycin esterase family protein [Actinoplanes octamycinicus]MBB4740927.1 erythromycin esterase-like protein [Actinoplanes octamycinicus]GIE55834.1 erythromycin esterase [Actinoplanes octamycinicus]
MTDLLEMLPVRPRVLALGEPTHGEDVLLEVRNELFRQLVEDAGYRTIALESDCLRGLLVDDHVRTEAGTLDEVMEHGFSHGFGRSPANRELVRWMRAHNERRPAAEQVRFAGFDGPLETAFAASPRQALTRLHAHLAERVDAELLPCTAATLDELLGDDDRWTDPAAMMDPARSVGRTPEAVRLRLLADDLVALLDATPGADTELARLHGRTATGLLRYHYWFADSSPGRLPWVLSVRAAMMAANLLALAERGPVLAFANNGHLQRHRSGMNLGGREVAWWSAGAMVSARLGTDYAFVATAVGAIRHRGIDVPPPDTVEGMLYAEPGDWRLVDPRRLGGSPVPRVSPWFGYTPLDPAHLTGHDAIVFVRDVPEGETWWPV